MQSPLKNIKFLSSFFGKILNDTKLLAKSLRAKS